MTPKQAAAVEFIANNPGATVDEIANAADASTSGSNAAEFLQRLIDNGYVQVVVTPDHDPDNANHVHANDCDCVACERQELV